MSETRGHVVRGVAQLPQARQTSLSRIFEAEVGVEG